MVNSHRLCSALLGLSIGALGYWFQAYNETTLFGFSIWALMSGASFIGALAYRLFIPQKPLRIALWVAIGVVLAVLLRIVYDTTFYDASSHNLAPFELAFTGLLTFPAAFLGALLGQIVKGAGKKK